MTTGPVTVPFVLALGVGFSTAIGAPEGFGILTSASVAPIISVLALCLVRRLMAGRLAVIGVNEQLELVSPSNSQYSTASKNIAGEQFWGEGS